MNGKGNPLISVIMVDGSFRESFHAIDFFHNQTFDDFELLWVEYYDRIDPRLQEKLDKRPNFRSLPLGKQGIYHSSYCFNAGVIASRADLVVIVDGDVAVENDFVRRVWNEHVGHDKLVMYVHRCNEPREKHAPDISLEHLRKVCRVTNPENYGGCLTVRKKWLLEINGYEQHAVFSHGEHANGRDVYTRLRNLGLHVAWNPDLRLYHPWHRGTLASAPSYRLQRIIIDHRAVSLSTSAFEGIDSSRNCAPPPEVLARIDAERASIAQTARNEAEKARSGEAAGGRGVALARAVDRARRIAARLLGVRVQ